MRLIFCIKVVDCSEIVDIFPLTLSILSILKKSFIEPVYLSLFIQALQYVELASSHARTLQFKNCSAHRSMRNILYIEPQIENFLMGRQLYYLATSQLNHHFM